MNTADVMLVGLEQVSEPDFARLQACVREWRVLWGLTLTHCLRLEDERDAFVLIAERTYREALDHLEECLRAVFPEHVIVAHAYVQGAHLPVYTMDEAGFELMQRMQRRTAHIVQDARAGKPSPLLPPRRPEQEGVAAWRERNHVIPSRRGKYLLCDACGDSKVSWPCDTSSRRRVGDAGYIRAFGKLTRTRSHLTRSRPPLR